MVVETMNDETLWEKLNLATSYLFLEFGKDFVSQYESLGYYLMNKYRLEEVVV